MGSKAFESPLISHARMRAMYRALVETRQMGESRRGRGGADVALPRGLEACWVGTAIGVTVGDLTIDRRGAAMAQYIRAVGVRAGTGAPRRAELRLLHEPGKGFSGGATDRMMCAIGAAMAMQAAGANGVVVAYVEQGEMKPEGWRSVLGIAGGVELPLLIVAVPGEKGRRFRLREMAHRKGADAVEGRVPVIPVDAADAVALYRVAQESLGRLRSGGGAVVIECVQSGVDPIELLARQMVAKKICTERWAVSVEGAFRTWIGRQAGAGRVSRSARTKQRKTA